MIDAWCGKLTLPSRWLGTIMATMNSDHASSKAVVIGSGVIGLFTAWRLLDAGFAVTVLERGEIGRSASWAAGGILSPLPPWQAHEAVWTLSQQSQKDYPGIAAHLLDATGVDPEWIACGMRVEGVSDFDAATQWLSERGLAVETGLAASSFGRDADFYLPWVAQVRSPRLMRALEIYLRQRGVLLVSGAEVTSFEQASGRIFGVRLRSGVCHTADVFVLCAGAWGGVLAGQVVKPLPIRPVRGQMILLQGAPGVLQHIVLAGDRYLIPRRDGCIVVGSTLEFTGFTEGVTAVVRESLLRFAHQQLPASKAMPVVAHWSGLRPAAPGGIPLVMAAEEFDGLFIHGGHYRNGINLAPASARRLLALVEASARI